MSTAADLEQSALENYQAVLESMTSARLKADRRSLRLRVKQLEFELSDDSLGLSFELPPGAYATTLINELVSTGH